jgi:hypothetical protein
MGKLIVLAVLVAGVSLPAALWAAPGNAAGELAREEIMFQGMRDQICNLYDNGTDAGAEAALNSLNTRRRAAYRKRGRPVPEDLFCEGGGKR